MNRVTAVAPPVKQSRQQKPKSKSSSSLIWILRSSLLKREKCNFYSNTPQFTWICVANFSVKNFTASIKCTMSWKTNCLKWNWAGYVNCPMDSIKLCPKNGTKRRTMLALNRSVMMIAITISKHLKIENHFWLLGILKNNFEFNNKAEKFFFLQLANRSGLHLRHSIPAYCSPFSFLWKVYHKLGVLICVVSLWWVDISNGIIYWHE